MVLDNDQNSDLCLVVSDTCVICDNKGKKPEYEIHSHFGDINYHPLSKQIILNILISMSEQISQL
jgi:hypothetical protein